MINQVDRHIEVRRVDCLCMLFHHIQSIHTLHNQTEPHEYQPMFPNENCSAYQKI